MGASALPMGVSTPPKWSRNIPMCLRNLQKNLVYGAQIEAEILTSLLPMYLLNLAWFLGTGAPPMDVSTLPKWSRNIPMCLRNLQKNLAHGALIEAKILTSPLPNVFAQFGPVFGHQHSAHRCVDTSQVVLKCSYMTEEPPKKIWCMGT